MANLITLVLVNDSLCDEVVHAWEAVGVPGLTIVESCGIRHDHRGQGTRDDLPIFPSSGRWQAMKSAIASSSVSCPTVLMWMS